MSEPLFSGSITALVTPFSNGAIDEEAFNSFVAWQIDEGTNALVPVGTTGESPAMSHEEHKRVVELCIKAANKRVPVIAGTGSNSTSEAIELTTHAQQAGAAGALVVPPYYNKPNQEGLYQHFQAIHDATDIPIVIYNIPGRSVIDMSVETMARLADLPRFVGVKDATGDMVRPWLTRQACGADFAQLTGNDETTVPFMAMGGHGAISVTANVAPRLCAEFHQAWQAGDRTRVQQINDLLMPLHICLFLEPNPQAVKFALSVLGKMNNELRLPMVPLAPATEAKVRDAMSHAGLIN